jgi:16S rRNA (uracil1498-N3)-methyltransferase
MNNITTLIYAHPKNIFKDKIQLDKDESYHIARVLRLKVDDTFYVTDGFDNVYKAVLKKVDDRHSVAEIAETNPSEGCPRFSAELPFEVTVAVGTIRPQRFEAMLDSLVQLGVRRIIPLDCRYSEKQNTSRLSGSQYAERLNRIAITAVKQSLRLYLPVIEDVREPDMLFVKDERVYDLIIYADIDGLPVVLMPQGKMIESLLLIVGPEGGVTHRETEVFKDNNAIPLSLGRTRLRTENAATVMTVKVLNSLGVL